MKFNKKEIYSSALMMMIGIGTVIGSLNYDIHTLARMGPGYFPLLLGGCLIVVAALILATQSIEEESSNHLPLKTYMRPWLCVIGGVTFFIVLGKYGGLVPATFVLVSLSALGDKTNSIKTVIGLGLFITALAVTVFHYGLRMQFSLFTWG